MRVTGDTIWLSKKDWGHFCDYEDGLNEVIGNQRLAVLCTYPLAGCGAPQILDVVRTHQFVLARRYGSWDVVETAALKRAKAEIARLNEELEQRVVERTNQLVRASEALREAQGELARVSRLTAMGELTASIAHELKQPIAAAITNSNTSCDGCRANRRTWKRRARRRRESLRTRQVPPTLSSASAQCSKRAHRSGSRWTSMT